MNSFTERFICYDSIVEQLMWCLRAAQFIVNLIVKQPLLKKFLQNKQMHTAIKSFILFVWWQLSKMGKMASGKICILCTVSFDWDTLPDKPPAVICCLKLLSDQGRTSFTLKVFAKFQSDKNWWLLTDNNWTASSVKIMRCHLSLCSLQLYLIFFPSPFAVLPNTG